MRLKIFLSFALISFAACADNEWYKTCQQSSFCRRMKKVSGASNYEVLASTLHAESSFVTVEVQNKVSQHLFVMKLRAVKGNMFHFEIDEKTPLKPRYRVTEALNGEPSYDIIDVTQTANDITVNSMRNKAVIKLSPFKIDFYQDGVLSVTVNGKGLMNFEELRTKPVTPDPNEELGSWEEEFMFGTDSKPNGPEAVALDFTFPGSDILFGIPEHAETFALKPTVGKEPYRLFTSDVPYYDLDGPMGLYGAVPVLYGHGTKNSAGIFWQNSADTFIDIYDAKSAHFMSEAGIVDVFILLGPTVKETFHQYTSLTGVTSLPQLFTIGYHQCKWNYMTQEEVIDVVDNFDKYELQLDTIWLDIEYTDGKKYFTWDEKTFSNPLQMMSNLSLSGRHLTFIIDPHIKKDLEYFFYKQNKERGFFIKDKDGNDYEASCWPGTSSWVDFFNPEARRHYADQYLLENFPLNSIETGIWNDMNEPAVFDVPEKTMSRDNIHYGGFEHRNVHNQYGLMHTKGTFDGLMRRGNGNRRPFILTRSFFAGSQRYTAIWTGDNGATWGYLQASIKMCLTLAVSGFSFCGADVGGFIGEPEEELFRRWYQTAAFQPFFRSHAELSSPRREPYLLPEYSRSIVREAIRKRYALLPFWYTLFYEHERDGLPIMRPMLSEYPLDKSGFALDDQFLLRDVLLVRPVMEKGVKKVNVHFPSTDGDKAGHIWYDTDDYRKIEAVGVQSVDVDDFKTPVYQRGGTIVPKKETIRKASVYMQDDPVTLIIAVDKSNQATGTLYIDDEQTYEYRRGQHLYLHFELKDNKLTSKKIDTNADYNTKAQLTRILIAGMATTPKYATLHKSGAEPIRVEIANSTEQYFIAEIPLVSLREEWSIELNGARQNIIGGAVLLLALAVKFLF